MHINRITNWLPPEGDFSGRITSAKHNKEDRNGNPREHVRHAIAVDPIPDDRIFNYCVGIDYGASKANDLILDAQKLLGSRANELVDNNGKIRSEKLHILVGKPVKFTVTHIYTGQPEAYRKVENLRPAKDNSRQAT